MRRTIIGVRAAYSEENDRKLVALEDTRTVRGESRISIHEQESPMAVQTTAYLDLQLQTLGKVKGDSATASLGRKNLIEVLAYHHDVVVQRDAAPAPGAGPRIEKPIRWSTPVGAASVALFQGLVANETIVKAVFRFFNHDRAGKEQEFYRVTVEDGAIDSMSTRLPPAQAADPVSQDEYHELEFSYRKITVENLIAGRSATDDSQSAAKRTAGLRKKR